MKYCTTYEDILKEFREKFPNSDYEDYRPCHEMYGVPTINYAIVLWLKDKSKIIYISDKAKAGNCDIEQVKKGKSNMDTLKFLGELFTKENMEKIIENTKERDKEEQILYEKNKKINDAYSKLKDFYPQKHKTLINGMVYPEIDYDHPASNVISEIQRELLDYSQYLIKLDFIRRKIKIQKDNAQEQGNKDAYEAYANVLDIINKCIGEHQGEE